jgi:hypothetical protein
VLRALSARARSLALSFFPAAARWVRLHACTPAADCGARQFLNTDRILTRMSVVSLLTLAAVAYVACAAPATMR